MTAYKTGLVALLMIILSAVVQAAASDKADTPYFTNKDLEKYARTPDELQAPATVAEPPKAADAAGKAEDRQKEYWCRKASSADGMLTRKQDVIDEVEKEIAEIQGRGLAGGKADKSLRKKLARAKREGGYAEKSLNEIADEAHRKGIPPGWLKCQFE